MLVQTAAAWWLCLPVQPRPCMKRPRRLLRFFFLCDLRPEDEALEAVDAQEEEEQKQEEEEHQHEHHVYEQQDVEQAAAEAAQAAEQHMLFGQAPGMDPLGVGGQVAQQLAPPPMHPLQASGVPQALTVNPPDLAKPLCCSAHAQQSNSALCSQSGTQPSPCLALSRPDWLLELLCCCILWPCLQTWRARSWRPFARQTWMW